MRECRDLEAKGKGLCGGSSGCTPKSCEDFLREAARTISASRPTAVNLMWAVDRVLGTALAELRNSLDRAYAAALSEARLIEAEDIGMNRRIGAYGAELIRPGSRVLTTATRARWRQAAMEPPWALFAGRGKGKISMVYADETRPYLKAPGSRRGSSCRTGSMSPSSLTARQDTSSPGEW